MSSLPPGFTFSQSSLQDYADCPRRFQLRYLERLAYPAAEAEPALENERRLMEGQAFHRLAQQYLLGIPAEKLTPFAHAPDASTTGLSTSASTGLSTSASTGLSTSASTGLSTSASTGLSTSASTRLPLTGTGSANLARWWEHFSGSAEIAELKTLPARYPEFTLSAPLGEFRLAAKYDLIAITDDERLLVYDWKTYHKRPCNEWLAIRWQTRVYRALLTAAGSQLNGGRTVVPERCEMVYWFAEFPNEPARFPYNASQFQRDWDALSRLADEIRSASSYPQTEDRQMCAYCAYRSYCERGLRAGDLEAMQMETELEILFDLDFEQIAEIAF